MQPFSNIRRFEDFIRLFQDSQSNFKYNDIIISIINNGANELVIFYEDLLKFDPEIAVLLRNNPKELLEDVKKAFKNILRGSGNLLQQEYFVRITTDDKSCPLVTSIKELNSSRLSSYLLKLVIVNGTVIARKDRYKKLCLKADFECLLCGAQFETFQSSKYDFYLSTHRIKPPKYCINARCKAKTSSNFKITQHEYYYYRPITIQEISNDPTYGFTKLKANCPKDLKLKMGDTLMFTGIFDVYADTIDSTVFNSILHINYIKR